MLEILRDKVNSMPRYKRFLVKTCLDLILLANIFGAIHGFMSGIEGEALYVMQRRHQRFIKERGPTIESFVVSSAYYISYPGRICGHGIGSGLGGY